MRRTWMCKCCERRLQGVQSQDAEAARSQRINTRNRGTCSAPKHPGSRLKQGHYSTNDAGPGMARGNLLNAGFRRRAWMLRQGGKWTSRANELPPGDRRQCETPIGDPQRHGFSSRPVRAALPLRMPGIVRRRFARTLAQFGRADGTPSGRRFESGASTAG